MRQNPFISQALYKLKREYGIRNLILNRRVEATVDFTTGLPSVVDRQAWVIPVAILLPKKLKLDSEYSQMKTKWSYEAYFAVADRIFILDRKDVPIEIQKHDYFVFEQKRYDVVSIEDFIQSRSWLILARETDGGKLDATYPLSVVSNVPITQELDHE